MLALPFSTRLVLRLIAAAALMTCCLSIAAANAGAAKPGHHHHRHHRIHLHRHAVTVKAYVSATPALRKAARARTHADHVLVAKAKQLKRCRRIHPGHCARQRRALQRAGTKLAAAERKLAKLGRKTSRARSAAGVAAPVIDVNGQTLSWNQVGRVAVFVLVRKVPGLPDQYSLVTGTSVRPPAVPGTTVHYSVRAAVNGSAWAREVAIDYAAVAVTPPSAPAPAPESSTSAPAPALSRTKKPVPVVLTQAAPDLNVAGQQLVWNTVSGITTYVLATKIAGRADQYTAVNGTSTTPATVPGQTVHYSIRTAVNGSAWSPEAAIQYPSTPAPTPAPAPAPDPTPAPGVNGSFSVGLVAGSALTYELPFVKQMGAHTARLTFDVNASPATMGAAIDAYVKAGIRPLLLATFYGRVPSTTEALNLATWAAAFGPGGSFWVGKSYGAAAPTDIEFGNETSYSYQFSDNSLGTYAARAQSYAQRANEAAIAIRAANPNVGLLAIGDNAVNQSAWMTNILKAVPDLGSRVAGWTIHPYGPTWQTRIDSTINSARAGGAPDLPIWITEWGVSTDNGRCLSDNYGFDKCMTYGAAATTLHDALAGMQARYGSRLGAFYLYQAHDQYASGTQSGREAYFGALQSNNASKGAFTDEVKADLAAN